MAIIKESCDSRRKVVRAGDLVTLRGFYGVRIVTDVINDKIVDTVSLTCGKCQAANISNTQLYWGEVILSNEEK